MPVVVASATRSADALINYALDDKPNQQGERYVMASGIGGMLVSIAKQQMRDIRKRWNKDKPGAFVQAYHVIESFAQDELDPDNPDSWMAAHELGLALAEERFPGRQVLVVTQRDGKGGCLHNHIVANSIETKTGRSLNSSIVTHARLVAAHERVLEAQGFKQRSDLKQAFSDATERFERGEPSSLRRTGSSTDAELREYQRHIVWETECDAADELGAPLNKQPFSLTFLKDSIQFALADPAAVGWDSFVKIGRSRGVQIEQRGRKGRGISYGMLRRNPDGTLAIPTPSDRRRCTTLGPDFEMDAVERALARNRSAATARAANKPTAGAEEPAEVARVDRRATGTRTTATSLAPAGGEHVIAPVENTPVTPELDTQRTGPDRRHADRSQHRPSREPATSAAGRGNISKAQSRPPGAKSLAELRKEPAAKRARDIATRPEPGIDESLTSAATVHPEIVHTESTTPEPAPETRSCSNSTDLDIRAEAELRRAAELDRAKNVRRLRARLLPRFDDPEPAEHDSSGFDFGE